MIDDLMSEECVYLNVVFVGGVRPYGSVRFSFESIHGSHQFVHVQPRNPCDTRPHLKERERKACYLSEAQPTKHQEKKGEQMKVNGMKTKAKGRKWNEKESKGKEME